MKRKHFFSTAIIVTAAMALMLGCGTAPQKDQSAKTNQSAQTEAETAASTQQQTKASEAAAQKKTAPLSTAEPEFTAEEIRRVDVQKEGKDIFEISFEPQEYKSNYAYWDIITPYKSMVMVDTEKMYSLYDSLTNLEFTEKAEIKEDTDTGLSNTGTSITIDYYDLKSEEDTQQYEPDTTCTIKIGAKDDKGNYYTQPEGDESVYLIAASTIDAVLQLNPYDYILKICCLVDYTTVETVEIQSGEETHTIGVNAADKKYTLNQKETDEKEFTTLYQALMGVIIKGEAKPEILTNQKEQPPILQYTFHRNQKEAPDITVSYKPYNEENYLVNVNGKEFFIVSKADIEQLQTQIKETFPTN